MYGRVVIKYVTLFKMNKLLLYIITIFHCQLYTLKINNSH